MRNRSLLRLIVTLCFFAFIVTVNANMRPVLAQSCDTVTDAQIVADVYAKVKADKSLASQISHINVVAVFAAVKLQGWADSKRDHEKVVGFALTGRCVKMVNVNLFAETPPTTTDRLRSSGGCASGTKPCGDVCIPEGDSCNIPGELN